MFDGVIPALDSSGAVWTNQSGLLTLFYVVCPSGGTIVHRNSFSNCNRKWNLSIDCLDDGSLRESRWNKNHADVSATFFHCFFNASKNRELLTLNLNAFASLLGVHTTNNIAATSEHALSVLHALGASHSLNNNFRVSV
jgi:hypothetical protein